jgi:hypothetical protein
MKITAKLLIIGLALASLTTLQSCNDDDKTADLQLALVTVKTNDAGKSCFQLDENTTLIPNNIDKPLYNGRELRALISYFEEETPAAKSIEKTIKLHGIDSILTKKTILVADGKVPEDIGNDPIEIVNDWTTCLEDGYLTLRIRARWSINPEKPHFIDLLAGLNSDNKYEVELRHNANGDDGLYYGDALVAFKLDDFDFSNGEKLTLKWKSYSGAEKSLEFTPWKRPADNSEAVLLGTEAKSISAASIE